MFFKKQTSCSCGGACSSQNTDGFQLTDEIKSVKVLGSGCKNCHTLKTNTDAALKELGLNIEAEYVTDIQKIMAYKPIANVLSGGEYSLSFFISNIIIPFIT